MKNLFTSFVFILIASFTSYAQFSDQGYKSIKLGMTPVQVKKLANFNIEDEYAKINFDGIDFEISFADLQEYSLFSITSNSPNAKLEGVKQTLIGKSLKEVKALLGNKIKESYFSDSYYFYYKDDSSRENAITSCLLIFNENGILNSISASYNP